MKRMASPDPSMIGSIRLSMRGIVGRTKCRLKIGFLQIRVRTLEQVGSAFKVSRSVNAGGST